MPRMRKLSLLAVVVALAIASVSAGQRATAPNSPAPYDTERLARIDKLLQQYVDENRIPGAVALVLRDGQPAVRARGRLERQGGGPADGADTIFRIASQSKAITSVAILMLMEEGTLTLTDSGQPRSSRSFAEDHGGVTKSDAPALTPEPCPAKRPSPSRIC